MKLKYLLFILVLAFLMSGNTKAQTGTWSSGSEFPYSSAPVGLTYKHYEYYYKGYEFNPSDMISINITNTSFYCDGLRFKIYKGNTEIDDSGDIGMDKDDTNVDKYSYTFDNNGTYDIYFTVKKRKRSGGSMSWYRDYFSIRIIIIDPVWEEIPDLCENGSSIYLPRYFNAPNGGYSSYYFTGSGVSGNFFYPTTAGSGNKTVILNMNSNTYTKTITVSALTDVVWDGDAEMYNTDGTINLSNYVDHSGGTFYVKESGGSTVYPITDNKYLDLRNVIPLTDESTNEKDIEVKYTYPNGGCIQVFTNTIKVNNNNIFIQYSGIPAQCADDTQINMANYFTPSGGTFEVSGNELVGASTLKCEKEGSTTIEYTCTQNGYSKTYTAYVTVHGLPDVNIDDLPRVCTNEAIDLTYNGTPIGGVWTGTGVNSANASYDPTVNGIGEFPLTYTYTNVHGCTDSYTDDIEVDNILPTDIAWSSIPGICEDASTIYLPAYINHTGGTFSGNGVTGDYFNPSTTGSGVITLKYQVTNESCKTTYTTTIEVYSNPSIVFNSIHDVCEKDTEIELSAYVNITGGTFSGTGVNSITGKFNSTDSGLGEHYIYYTTTDNNGCSSNSQQTIEVNGEIPNDISFSDIADICIDGEVIDLSSYVNYSGGRFSGSGVTGESFDPSEAGTGVKTIRYTYTSGSCDITLEKTVNVLNETSINYWDFPTVCTTSIIDLEGYVDVTGGTFSGRGVNGYTNEFTPVTAGLGSHPITYTYTNSLGCETRMTQTIYVDLLIDSNISFSSISDKCINSSSVYLRDYINSSDGSFSGTGVSGDYFNPSVSGVGTWTVIWTNNNGGCSQELTTVITVASEPDITFNSLPNTCNVGEEITLNAYVSQTGGTFNGPGVVNGIFYADQVTEGTYPINYVYTSGDCQVTETQTIFVKGKLPNNLTFNDIPNQCIDGSPIDLSNYVNNSNGTFSGTGVTATYFDPYSAGVGVHEISYTITSGGCSQTLKTVVVVESNTSVTFNDLGIICTDDLFNLNNYVSHTGGTFSGPGVSGNTFTPTTAGVGDHIINYTYTNSLGCNTSVSRTVSVDMLVEDVVWSSLPDMCVSSSKIYLPDYLNHSGGSFRGQGVTGEYFDPSVSGIGTFTIKYTVTGGRCSEEFTTTVTVSEGLSVTFSSVTSVCFNEEINLNNYVSHTGGTFSGPGVNGSIFDPSVTGRGDFIVNYTYSNSMGCEISLNQTISVIDLLEDVTFTSLPIMCESSNPMILDSYITNHTTGTFSGTGVTNNVFDPEVAGAGIHLLKYTINNGGCYIELKQNITVHPKVDVTFNSLGDICYDRSIDLSTYVSPSGGTFSGNGVDGNTFSPSDAGIGSHIIQYSFISNNGCETVASVTVNVLDLIDIDIKFETFPELCAESNNLYLPNFINHTGGTFSGSGVTGNYFNPSVAGTGSHLIYYTIIKGTCTIEISDVISIFSEDEIIFSSIPKQCYSSPINLEDYISPLGGTFSGSGVTNNVFDPSDVGLGTYTITYEYTNDKGCKGSATQEIEVVDLMSEDVTFSSLPEICPEGSVINLRNYVNSIEGIFTGTGVTGEYFDPADAGSGVHKILFEITNGSCQTERYQSIIVTQSPALVFNEVSDICYPDEIDLGSYVLPKGGVFSGSGMAESTFNPSVAGKGAHTITYMYTDGNGCINTKEQELKVIDLVDKDLVFNPLPDICSNANALKLSDYISNYTTEGSFSGDGVSGAYFNPSQTGEGVYYIEYEIGNGNCNTTVGQTIEVVGISDNIKFFDIPSVCTSTPINLREYTTVDGIFQGVGVADNTFNPSVAGKGTHTISFTVTNSLDCEYVITKEIEVIDLLPSSVSFNDLPDVCESSEAVNLREYVSISDGSFSGSGVDGDNFNATTVSAGTYTIKFTFSNGNCEQNITKTITVHGKEEIYINPFPMVCNTSIIDLDQYVTLTGGTWSGIGVTNSVFDPSIAGLGEKVITYTYTNGFDCKTILQSTIDVKENIPGGISFNTLPDICIDATPVNLFDYISGTDDGKFSGTGVESSYFDPGISGSGVFTVTFETGTTTTCKKTYVQTIIVHEKQEIVFNSLPVKCDDSSINLNDYVSRTGGTFSGPGVSGTTFNPQNAGIGEHVIIYNYSNNAGCETTITQTIIVPVIYPEITFSAVSTVCENGINIDLSSYVNYAGGTFSGSGVTGNTFSPSEAGAGTHIITYVMGNETCSKTVSQSITVIEVPVISFSTIPDICFDERINLTDYMDVAGTFSGRGVNGNYFNPSEAGVGNHKITFYYSNNNCTSQATTTINVISVIDPDITFYPVSSLCVDASPIDLGIYTNASGTFSGDGLTGNIFIPSEAGAGVHEITLAVGNGDCSKEYKQFITVYANTTLSVRDIPSICHGEIINLDNYVNITGGTYSGENVKANYFYPTKVGNTIVTYTYTNNNSCTSSIEFSVKVEGMYPTDVSFDQPGSVCLDNGVIDLRDYVSYYDEDNSFSGTGVVGYYFDPEVAGAGVHQMTYTVGKGDCVQSYNRYITVNELPELTLNIPEPICEVTLLDLSNYINIQGGKFTGNGVSGNIFDPSSAGLGDHNITYEYTDDNGCNKYVSQLISVLSLNPISINFQSLGDVCSNGEPINLRNYVNDTNVIFEGKGVTSYYFYPSVAEAGTHVITCKVGDKAGCVNEYTQSINVNALPDIGFLDIPPVCFNEPINLLNYVDDLSGSFYGDGVINNTFDPSIVGIGIHKITYIVGNQSNCYISYDKTIEVKSLYTDNIKFNPIPDLCVNYESINLSDYVSLFTGNFSGTGVLNSMFDPYEAGPGTHQITYTVGDSECARNYTQYVTVYPQKEIVFSSLPEICEDQFINLEENINVTGGYFAGINTEGNVINTADLSVGTHVIEYVYTDQGNGCITSIQRTLVINGHKPDITFEDLPDMCEIGAPIYLTNYVDSVGGVFSGTGVKNSVFTPSEAGVGTHKIIYTIYSGLCEYTFEKYVTIYPSLQIEFMTLPEICGNDTIDLKEYVSVSGGSFSGMGVKNDSLFTANLSIGTYNITYTFNDPNACEIVETQSLIVNGHLPDNVIFSPIAPLCENSANVSLTEYVNNITGNFSGEGVANSVFNPSEAGAGTHKISYTFENGSCETVYENYITVYPLRNVVFSELPDICEDQLINLTTYVNVSGGTFTGEYVVNGTLNTADMPVGNHVIEYNYQDPSNACEISLQQTIKIKGHAVDVTFLDIPDMCEMGSSIYLTDYVDYVGGSFNGTGVRNSVFSPESAGAGSHRISYTVYSGLCEYTFEKYVTVYPSVEVEFMTLPEVCGSDTIDLRSYVSVAGGSFSGMGVKNDSLFTANLSIGTYNITYTFNDPNGCKIVETQSLIVNGHLPDNVIFSPIAPLCENSEVVYLTDYVNNITGNFSGEGVANSVFNPSEAGAGTHRISYTFENGSCKSVYQNYITVYPLRNVVFSTLPEICEDQEIDLTGYVNIQGGTFTGLGVTKNTLSTVGLPLETNQIIYEYTDDNGCTTTTISTCEISGHNPPSENITFDPLEDICVNSSPIDLSPYVNSTEGVFSGAGVTGTILDPTEAGYGIHLITYTIGSGNCEMEYTKSIEIKNAPNLTFHDFPSLCYENDVINLNNYVSIQGGTFTGSGIEGVLLKRSSIDVGIYSVFYSYETINGCTITIEKSFTVEQALPSEVIFNQPSAICVNGGKINLHEFVNVNGIFSGTGVESDGLFNPATAGIGEHRITFAYGNGTCLNTTHQYITVTDPKNVTFSNINKVCNDIPINLNDYVNYKGGTFSGRGVDDTTFDPADAGEGIHLVSYEYSDGLCVVNTTQTIEVLHTGSIQINLDKSSVNSSALVKFWSSGVDIVDYIWGFGDGGYSLEKEPFHYYYHDGTFDVQLECTDINGCSHVVNEESFITVLPYSSTIKSSVIQVNNTNATIGLHYEDESNREAKIYPNPFKEIFNIELKGYKNSIRVFVRNINGILVKEINQKIVDEDIITVDLNGYAKGIYIVNVQGKIFKAIKK